MCMERPSYPDLTYPFVMECRLSNILTVEISKGKATQCSHKFKLTTYIGRYVLRYLVAHAVGHQLGVSMWNPRGRLRTRSFGAHPLTSGLRYGMRYRKISHSPQKEKTFLPASTLSANVRIELTIFRFPEGGKVTVGRLYHWANRQFVEKFGS